jgi:hypothetical protein
MGDNAGQEKPSYAFGLANDSYQLYRTAAIRSRRSHRISSIAVMIVAAAIPVSAAISPKNSIAPAVLGAIVVVVPGCVQYSIGKKIICGSVVLVGAVEAERRLYLAKSRPYDNSDTRDRILAVKLTSIEQQEMAG